MWEERGEPIEMLWNHSESEGEEYERLFIEDRLRVKMGEVQVDLQLMKLMYWSNCVATDQNGNSSKEKRSWEKVFV